MNIESVENFNNGVAEMLIYGSIGQSEDNRDAVNGSHFARDLSYLSSLPEVTSIKVRINSQGGVVMDAMNIISAIRNSKTPVETIVEGIAASSAGLIAMAGHTRSMLDFSRLMIHAPNIPETARAEMSENTTKMLDEIQDMIISIISSSSKMSKNSVVKMMTNDNWFNAKDAKAKGFIDNIINTDRDFDEMFNSLDLTNCDLGLIVNQINNKKKIKTMDLNKVKATLKLDSSVAVEVVENKVAELVTNAAEAVSNLAAEKTAHQATKDALTAAEAKVTTINNAAAAEYVENKIKLGMFNKESKDILVTQAQNNFEAFKSMCEAMPVKANSISNQIKPEGNEGGEGEKLEGKTLRELEKEDPAKVQNLLDNDLETYKKLYKAEYGSDYVG